MENNNIVDVYFEFHINIINCDFSEIYTEIYNAIRKHNIIFNRTLPNNLVLTKSLEPKYSMLGEPVNTTIISFLIKINSDEYLNLYNKFKKMYDSDDNILIMNIIVDENCEGITAKSYYHYMHERNNFSEKYIKNNVLNYSFSTKHAMEFINSEEEIILKLFIINSSDYSENKIALQKFIYLINKYNYFYLDKEPVITKNLKLNGGNQSSMNITSYEFKLFNFEQNTNGYSYYQDIKSTLSTSTNILGLREYRKNKINSKFDRIVDLYKLMDSIDLDKIY